jgi:mannose-6-phosphate isomerase-like protein (cupin superfamily)
MKTRYADTPAYVTKDGSEIRELLHPDHHGNCNQSLAEAIVPSGTCTLLHLHRVTEEIYHITAGRGLMHLGGERFPVEPGDSIMILPGTPHCIEAVGNESLHILCCCSPAYTHEDTELLEN